MTQYCCRLRRLITASIPAAVLPRVTVTGAIFLAMLSLAQAQGIDDVPVIDAPQYASGAGPVIAFDKAHLNYHTLDKRYRTLGEYLRRDGYQVRSLRQPLANKALAGVDILVIANALHEKNLGSWELPVYPAFSDNEVQQLVAWVESGGSLLLIADHIPFAGAAEGLAAAFGVRFLNGYALPKKIWPPQHVMIFDRKRGGVRAHQITDGTSGEQRIDRVVSFLGQAFQVTGDYQPLLVFGEEAIAYLPVAAGQPRRINEWPSVGIGGWLQGAVAQRGKGRIAVFGESLMFAGPQKDRRKGKNGLFPPHGAQNPQLVRRLFRWLAQRQLEDDSNK